MKRGLPALFILLALLVPAKALAVKINEFVANADQEWVEFFNDDLANDVLMTYWVDDDTNFASDSGSQTIQSLGNLNSDNPIFPYFNLPVSMFNNGGDLVVLFDDQGGVVDQFTYAIDPGPGVSIGRIPDGTGAFSVLGTVSKGTANAPTPTVEPSPDPTAEPTPEPTAEPTPTDVPPTPTLEPSPTEEPTPTEVPPTPTVEPFPTVEPSPTDVPPTPTIVPSPTPEAPQETVIDAGILTCRINYTPKTLFGWLIWWPKLSCEKNTGD